MLMKDLQSHYLFPKGLANWNSWLVMELCELPVLLFISVSVFMIHLVSTFFLAAARLNCVLFGVFFGNNTVEDRSSLTAHILFDKFICMVSSCRV